MGRDGTGWRQQRVEVSPCESTNRLAGAPCGRSSGVRTAPVELTAIVVGLAAAPAAAPAQLPIAVVTSGRSCPHGSGASLLARWHWARGGLLVRSHARTQSTALGLPPIERNASRCAALWQLRHRSCSTIPHTNNGTYLHVHAPALHGAKADAAAIARVRLSMLLRNRLLKEGPHRVTVGWFRRTATA
jgi:hypothetical protein